MPKFTTNLAAALAAGDDVNEYFRRSLETAINQLLESERTVFLDYEKWDPVGYNSGNSRNGYYSRTPFLPISRARLRWKPPSFSCIKKASRPTRLPISWSGCTASIIPQPPSPTWRSSLTRMSRPSISCK